MPYKTYDDLCFFLVYLYNATTNKDSQVKENKAKGTTGREDSFER
jgi:hypothetical protein